MRMSAMPASMVSDNQKLVCDFTDLRDQSDNASPVVYGGRRLRVQITSPSSEDDERESMNKCQHETCIADPSMEDLQLLVRHTSKSGNHVALA